MDRSATFLASLSGFEPPHEWSAHLRALWWLRRGEPERAHALVQALDDPGAAAIHAHLHRIEGDLSNAHYWYARAGRPPCTGTADAEWTQLLERFLQEVSGGSGACR